MSAPAFFLRHKLLFVQEATVHLVADNCLDAVHSVTCVVSGSVYMPRWIFQFSKYVREQRDPVHTVHDIGAALCCPQREGMITHDGSNEQCACWFMHAAASEEICRSVPAQNFCIQKDTMLPVCVDSMLNP